MRDRKGMNQMKRQIPALITLATGLLLPLSTFLSIGRKLDLPGITDKWHLLIVAGTFMIGSIGLTRMHVANIIERKEGWGYSAVLVTSLWGYFIFGLIDTATGSAYNAIYNATVIPMQSSIAALMAIYVVSAAYRAFRVRNVESGILLVAAVLVMIGQVPIGEAISSKIPAISTWIMHVPNSATMRGLQIGIRLATIAVAFRVIFGLESAHIGGE